MSEVNGKVVKSGRNKMKIYLEDIINLISEPYFSNGVNCFEQGFVYIESVSDSKVLSRVAGTGVYKVILKRNGNFLNGKCTCPSFRKYGPCKHMAATGLALIPCDQRGKYGQREYNLSSWCANRIKQYDRYEKFLLKKKTKKELAEMILNWKIYRGRSDDYDYYDDFENSQDYEWIEDSEMYEEDE